MQNESARDVRSEKTPERRDTPKRSRTKSQEESGRRDVLLVFGVFRGQLGRVGEWKDHRQQGAAGIGVDGHVATQFADALSHSGDTDARLPSSFIQLLQ